jgi:serine/threonine-protein kinase HipA
MPRPRTRVPLGVFLNSRLAGRLIRETSGAVEFRYDPDWLAWPHALPISHSLPLREDRFIGERVVAVFDNLLPDGEPIRRLLALRVRAAGSDAFSLLSAIGRDCVGALQFLPEGQEPTPAGTITARPVSEAAVASILRNLERNPLGIDDDEEFRISIAGAQEKTALLRWKGRWHVPHGTTPTTHILKPAIGKLPNGLDLSRSVENEHLCMRLVDAFGLPAAKTEIAEFDGKRVLVVERFDRSWTDKGKRLIRLPQEDCCQALSVPPSRKYESDGGPGIRDLATLLKGSDDPIADRRALLKAQAVFWLLGATDGHAKNFSLYLYPGGRFRLTPLYDIMSAQPNVDAGQIRYNKMKLAMAIGRQRHYAVNSIAPRHFEQTAADCGIPSTVIDEIFAELHDTVPSALDRTLEKLPAGFPQQIAGSIAGGVRARLKLLTMKASPA